MFESDANEVRRRQRRRDMDRQRERDRLAAEEAARVARLREEAEQRARAEAERLRLEAERRAALERAALERTAFEQLARNEPPRNGRPRSVRTRSVRTRACFPGARRSGGAPLRRAQGAEFAAAGGTCRRLDPARPSASDRHPTGASDRDPTGRLTGRRYRLDPAPHRGVSREVWGAGRTGSRPADRGAAPSCIDRRSEADGGGQVLIVAAGVDLADEDWTDRARAAAMQRSASQNRASRETLVR